MHRRNFSILLIAILGLLVFGGIMLASAAKSPTTTASVALNPATEVQSTQGIPTVIGTEEPSVQPASVTPINTVEMQDPDLEPATPTEVSVLVATEIPLSSATPLYTDPTESLPVTPNATEIAALVTPTPTAQTSSTPIQVPFDQLYTEQGDIIAQGTNTTPIPASLLGPTTKLLSYKVDRITLASPIQVQEGPHAGEIIEHVWHFHITGENWMYGADSCYLWLNNTLVGTAVLLKSGDQMDLITLISDSSVLQENASIGISYGESPSDKVLLAEHLHMTQNP